MGRLAEVLFLAGISYGSTLSDTYANLGDYDNNDNEKAANYTNGYHSIRHQLFCDEDGNSGCYINNGCSNGSCGTNSSCS